MGYTRKAAVSLALVLAIIPFSGCGDDCEQDYPPPSIISTASSPYTISTLSSDLGISSTRWENTTNGQAGSGTVTPVYECVIFLGCGNWNRVVNEIPLTPGINIVYVYVSSDGCEWRDDYEITLN